MEAGYQGSPRCGSGHGPEADPGRNTGPLGRGQRGGRPAPHTACESRGGHSGHRQAHCLAPPAKIKAVFDTVPNVQGLNLDWFSTMSVPDAVKSYQAFLETAAAVKAR